MSGALLVGGLQGPASLAGPTPSGPTPAGPTPAVPRHAAGGKGASFGEVLANRLGAAGELKFSSHALDRIERRGIPLDEQSLARLHGGVARAAAKGSRESLVLVDDTAFVVSVRNRTVVTAVGREHMKEQVFTNIDSAVIA